MTVTSTARIARPNINEILNPNRSDLQQHTAEVVLPTPDVQSSTSSQELQVLDIVNLLGSRPIVASDLQVSDTIHAAGIRPIAVSDLQVSETIDLLGMRPIASSELNISKTITTSGVRPIAANKSDKIEALMGYLD